MFESQNKKLEQCSVSMREFMTFYLVDSRGEGKEKKFARMMDSIYTKVSAKTNIKKKYEVPSNFHYKKKFPLQVLDVFFLLSLLEKAAMSKFD